MRRDAREIIFKLVFEYLFRGKEDELMEEELKGGYEYSLTKLDKEFIDVELSGIIGNIVEIKEIIAKYSAGFAINRIYKTDLALLILAVYEITYVDELPFQVTVNEVLNLAKRFGTEKSASFINGILASYIKALGLSDEKAEVPESKIEK